MDIEEIRLELEFAGVDSEQINKLIRACKNNGFDAEVMDRKLISMGYGKVFTLYDDLELEEPKKEE